MARVLVVDSSTEWSREIELLLVGAGHGVTRAASPSTAMERIRAAGVDFVVTDLWLGAASGLDVIDACRARQPPLQALLVTAAGPDELRSTSERAPVAVLSKREEPSVFAKCLLDAVAGAHAT